MWYLFFFVVAGVSGILIWDFRRKAARREAASQERFEKIFNAKTTAASTPESAPAADQAAITAAAKPASIPKTPNAAAALAVKERFLGQPETLIYLLLKTGIPDHEIFANVSLAAVIGVAGGGHEREQQLRRLSQYQVDFVVCDKSMRVVAAVEVESAADPLPAGDRRFKEECLKSGGVRLIRIDSAAPPRREEIRKLVAGA